MAAFSVAFDGTRVVDASSTTGWTAEGATPTAEPDFFYQGTGSISAKVKTSEAGFYYTSSSTDMTTPRVWIAKILATTKDGLDGNGLLVRIGSSTTAYYEYRKFSSTTYPVAGGWQILCIDPNVAGWRDATGGGGAPTLSAIIYWAIRGDFAATAKAENLAMDAIDYITNGTGLTGTDGTGGGGNDGTFAKFLTADEGTANNRWGVIQSKSGILYVNGVLTIGSATATVFTDTLQTIVFPTQYVTTGFCGIDVDLQHASTVVAMTLCVFRGRGTLTGSDDTRPDYFVSGTSGSVDFSGSQFNVYRLITFNSKVTAKNCVFVSGGDKIVASDSDIRGSSVSGYAGTADSYSVEWNSSNDPDGNLDDMTFTKGSGDAHAIGFGTSSATTMTLRGIDFGSGYSGTNGDNSTALWFADKGSNTTWTVNLIGCSGTIAYKKARTGDTVNLVINPVTLTVHVQDVNTGTAIDNARVLVLVSSAVGGYAYNLPTTITRSGSTATATATAHGMAAGDYAFVQGADQPEYNGVFQISNVTANTFDYTVSGTPTTPATGTITTTFALIHGLTGPSPAGEISKSKSYSSSQPITGKVRKATTGTKYKTAPITGTVDSTAGLTLVVQLIPDE